MSAPGSAGGPDDQRRPGAAHDGLAREILELDGVPSLAALYAKGVTRPLVDRLPGRGPAGGTPADLPPVTYRVGALETRGSAVAGRLAAYAAHVGEPPSDVLPAGFVHVLAFPVATAVMTRADFPLPLLGLVHLENAVEVRRPVRLGDTLEVLASADDLRPHRRGTQVDLVTEIRTGGELAWRGRSTYLAKDVVLGDGSPADARPADGGSGDGDHEATTWARPLPTARWTLDAGTGRRYAAISGDRNPIHLSALSAKAFGFPRAIAHGMDTAARALASVAARRPDAYEWTARFAKPVLLPGTVDVAVTPTDDGWSYDAWHGRSGRRNLSGAIVRR
ncbi:MaoC/PaaZ C-terminal domain-containing protein [Luteimicrobium subarcticum]|uniref:MaoC dehydratase-like protein n=1 Tax=Luteimicrobium subarcticum TaxID=620910 RepID=A0A2M8WSA0_9MICO|nr:MaoC/PaaZ C-terminal domain-containing protein [Luteimicrobium subarcticum]PJI93800.1 MaoC dehydratase-like protein [Luteimicrobium subarcticum]